MASLPKPERRYRVSLVLEVGELQGVAAAARVLAVDLRDDYPGPAPREVLHRLDAVASTLALLEQRLRLLRLAISGELDPAMLMGDHNRVDDNGPEGIEDLLLSPRSR